MENKVGKVYTIAELKDKLTPVFEGAPVYRAILFGSYAKGAADGDSDVDIIIDSRRELININFYGVVGNAEDAVGKYVDMYEISQIRPESPIYPCIGEGVVIYER
ncbi:MAG: nucleotidyltransferase domain-containing protein [Clostridiales bacterium]|jgi:predicted nucleotidyltransferase|nr:nucleotidyltransferase domain-containing protein [Clostridiales bacterium]